MRKIIQMMEWIEQMTSYQWGILVGAAVCLVSVHVEFGFNLFVYVIAISSVGAIIEMRLTNETKR